MWKWLKDTFFFILAVMIAVIVTCFLFLVAMLVMEEALNITDRVWGAESYTAVCPCRVKQRPKVLLMDAESPDDMTALRRIAWHARHDTECWGCRRGFPLVFDCGALFHVQRFLEDRYRVVYLGGEE